MWCVPDKLQALADKNRGKQGHVGCGLFPQPTAHTCCAHCVLGDPEQVNTLKRQARLFRLVRPIAAPGSRMLAEGAEWSDGAVALRWLGRWASTSTWDDIEALLAVHAADGDTRLHWLDPPPVRPAAPPPEPQEKTVWLPAPAPDGLCSRCGRPWPCLDCGP
ncbi:hypothetical protein EV137_5091 [Kribbella pratensis]|jgi:hypothetical protein|uniref:Uncharacterized protein n=1 Tax=Kribbella pratensis TaxID=2512112 RepID=A0ABY2F8W4_9ACTN|nr:hypothetical protein EV137_5091 [Kribbella pratensis]TDW91655.1 hypothetical protein EV647_5237 [Kribbella sp. VKM Ac-2566]